MINMLKAFIDKVGSMQEQMGHVSRDKNSKKEPKKMPEMKSTGTKMKKALMGSLVDWTRLRQKFLNPRLSQ